MRIARVLVLPLVLAVAPACGGGGGDDGGSGGSGGTPTAPSGGGTSTTPSTSSEIRVADNSFSPSATTVAAGTAVTWTWAGASPHDVTFDDGQKSGTQVTGTYQRTFAAAGTFPYHCSVHGASMSGTVTVR